MAVLSSILFFAAAANALPNYHLAPRAQNITLSTSLNSTESSSNVTFHHAPGERVLKDEYLKDWYYGADAPKKTEYQCIGPKIQDFPGMDKWLSFDLLWKINEPRITFANKNCTKYNGIIRDAIHEVSAQTKVDARLILAMMMQESNGNVLVECTNTWGAPDCGIMQMGGSRNFTESDPERSIKDMIEDGVRGTRGLPGFGQETVPGLLTYMNGDTFVEVGNDTTKDFWHGNPYAAVHLYNAGNILSEDLTVGSSATNNDEPNPYAHDVLSRLMGWDGSGCEAQKCDKLPMFKDKKCWEETN